MRIRAPKDFWSGLLFLAIGLAGAMLARNYAFGSTLRMGPGFMPTVLSWITAGLGVIVIAKSLSTEGAPVGRFHLLPMVLVFAAILAFALTIERFGLIVATVATVLIGGLASREAGPVERIALAVGLAAFCGLVFVVGLGQSMRLWPL